jgi:hypothetical protein
MFTPTIAAGPYPRRRPEIPVAPSVYVWSDGTWWASDGSTWVAIATDLARSSGASWGPVDTTSNPELTRFAAGELEASQRQPVARSMGSGVVLFSLEQGAAAVRHLVAGGDVAALPPPPVAYVLEPHGPGGMPSVRRSVDKVAKQIAADFRRREVIEWARGVIADANLSGPRGRIDPDAQVAALFADLKSRTVFVRDPVNTEAVASTVAILCLDPAGACLRGGDCDDMLVALGSGAEAIGIPVRLCTRTYPGHKQAHIVMQYDSARTGPSVWKCIDPSTETGQCSGMPYSSEILTEIETGSTPMFVGIGDTDASTLGDPAAQTMSADQAAGWVQLLIAAKTTLDNSAARLETNAAAYAQVRSDLALQPVDPTPSSETASAGPIVDYVSSVTSSKPVWTQAASDAQQKLLATTTFLSTALADALAGTRALYFNNGDLFVASKPGDPYGVLLVPNAQGVNQLQYVDVTTNAPTGTVGILPIILAAAAVAVVSIAAAYAVSKYCDYLAQAHHDDAMQKISDNQSQLIASGKETPEQAAAQVKALTDLSAAAPPPAPSVSTDVASIAKWVAIAAVAIAATFGLVTVSRIVALTVPAGRGGSEPLYRPRRLGSRRRARVRHRTMRVAAA